MRSIGYMAAGFFLVGLLYAAAIFTDNRWIIVVAILVAVFDSRRVRLWRYESEIAYPPGTLLWFMLLFGWIILPWYIALRMRIADGSMPLKEEYRWIDRAPPEYREPVPPPGLVQPWSRGWRQRFWGSALRRPRR